MEEIERLEKEINYWKGQIKTADIDHWKHRSMNMKCKTCMWFMLKLALNKEKAELGRCRKKAPTLDGWPVVYLDDWCGDHKLLVSSEVIGGA